jgi:hypothetical protein
MQNVDHPAFSSHLTPSGYYYLCLKVVKIYVKQDVYVYSTDLVYKPNSNIGLKGDYVEQNNIISQIYGFILN